jgi:hypothetical protein
VQESLPPVARNQDFLQAQAKGREFCDPSGSSRIRFLKEAWDKCLAVGIGQIKSDAILFRFKDETWEFRAIDVLGYKGIAHYNGSYYEAPVKKLRLLAKAEKHG